MAGGQFWSGVDKVDTLLRYIEGMSYCEGALYLDLSEVTVKPRIRAGLRNLRVNHETQTSLDRSDKEHVAEIISPLYFAPPTHGDLT